MVVVFWIIAIILLIAGIAGIIFCWCNDIDCDIPFSSFLAISIGSLAIVALLGGFDDKNPQPKAIDVYRGKTTLQITYQDTIPIDSVVVWKPEFKPVIKKK